MKEVDWSSIDPSQNKSKGNGGIPFVKFTSNKTEKLRPFGRAIEFYKIFIEKGKPSIIVDANDKDAASKLLSDKMGKEIKASYRNAMFVFDRNDGNKVKILEAGFQVFEQFASWSSATKIDPGSGQAVDWTISVTGDGVGGSNPRKYVSTPLMPVPFTEQEKSVVKGLKDAGKLKLSNYFKEVPLNKVLEVVFGSSGSASSESESEGELVGAGATESSDMQW